MTFSENFVFSGGAEMPAPLSTDLAGFVSFPASLQAGLTGEQVAWQQALYQRAYAEALRTVGYRPVESHEPLLTGLGAHWRN